MVATSFLDWNRLVMDRQIGFSRSKSNTITVKYKTIIDRTTAIAVEMFGDRPIGILYNMTPGVSPDIIPSNDNNVLNIISKSCLSLFYPFPLLKDLNDLFRFVNAISFVTFFLLIVGLMMVHIIYNIIIIY